METGPTLSRADRQQLAASVDRVRGRIEAACSRAGRKPDEITLVAVTKYVGPPVVQGLVGLGLRHLAENRVGRTEELRAALGDVDATWHMVGHIQSRKARRAAEQFDWIHSLDSFKLARKLDAAGPGLMCLVQVDYSGAPGRSGFDPGAVLPFLEQVQELAHLEVRGLMTLAPLGRPPRPVFARLRALRDEAAEELNLELPCLSMGMSGDFEHAIAEGATHLRIGSALYEGLDKLAMVREAPEGTLVLVTVRPKARMARLMGEHAGRLKLSVQAPPEKGRANKAVLQLLAEVLEVKAGSLTIRRGATSRDKDVLVPGLSVAEVQGRLARHFEE